MMILPTYSAAKVQDGVCKIDRKFHTGICLYAKQLPFEILVLAPELQPTNRQMDLVSIPLDELPYRVETIKCDKSYRLDTIEKSRVEVLVSQSSLVYGIGFETQRIAYKLGKPFIPILEYTVQTQIQMARQPMSSPFSRSIRASKIVWRFLREVGNLRRAKSIHCNGYPVFEQTKRFHGNCLLYIDSRMYENMVISAKALDKRLDTLGSRRPRLIYSGRYEAVKGALDVVEVGLELKRLGIRFELDLYGKGGQASAMLERVRSGDAGEYIRIHDAVPFPKLVEISRASDVFICCHIQDDPSCSYLEAFGSGLAMAGYDNRMWRALSRDAKTGAVTPMSNPAECARSIATLLADPERVKRYSRSARKFALEHCFEREFKKRIDALNTFMCDAMPEQPSIT